MEKMKKTKSPLTVLHERENRVLIRFGFKIEEMGIDPSHLPALTDMQFEDLLRTLENIEDGKPIYIRRVW
jgi:hypothetical protein